MSKRQLKQSFRCCSGPALFLFGVCTSIGVLFLSLHSGAGWIFLLAAGSVLLAFSLLGAHSGRGTALQCRHLAPKQG